MSGQMHIPCFKEEEEDWCSFQDRLECYFIVKEVRDEVKVHTLIMGLSPRQYQVLKDLVSPSVPSSLDYSTVLQTLKKHYGGQKNPRVERTKFRTTARADDETIQDFAVRLKHASRHCSFGNNLNQMLVDQLIAGVRSKCAATKLLEASEGLQLTFNKAIEIAETAMFNEQSSAMYTNSASDRCLYYCF